MGIIKNLIYRILFVLALAIGQRSSHVLAQADDLSFRSLTTNDGLVQNSVIDVLQDDNGFIWFATYEGLSRFDGYEFKNYSRTKIDTLGLSDNQIRSVSQFSENTLMIGTENGFNLFHTHTEEFIRFFHDPDDQKSLSNNIVMDVLADSDGDIWLATWGGGLNNFDHNGFRGVNLSELNGEFKSFVPHEEIFTQNSLKTTAIAEDHKGMLWISSLEGLFCFDKLTETFKVYRNDPVNKNSLSGNNISCVAVDHHGLVWCGTWGDGLNVLNPESGEVIRFSHNPDDKSSIANDIVMDVFVDSDGTVWAGTWGSGLCKVNYSRFGQKKEDISFTTYDKNLNVSTSISGNSIYCIYEDKQGLMWAGTDWAGVNKFKKEERIFKHIYPKPGEPNSLLTNVVFSIIKSSHGEVWIGTDKGVHVFDPKTNTFRNYQHDPDDKTSITHNFVKSIVEDAKGDIWFGGLRGLFKYNREKDNFDRVFIDHNELYALCAASDGTIWGGTYGNGVYRYNPKDRTVNSIRLESDEENYLIDNVIWSLAEDADSIIWIGSREAGLYSFNPKNNEFKVYKHDPYDSTSISHNTVVSLFVDHNDGIWVGTELGLDKVMFTSGGEVYFRRLSMSEDEGAKHIKGITEDNFQNLWITTTNGLTRYDVVNDKFLNFNLYDGIQNVEFHSNSIFVDKEEGVIYAGGINGFNYFNPKDVEIDLTPPKTKITALKIFNKTVEVGQEIEDRVILESTITSKESLTLSYREKVFSLAYAAEYYAAPEGCNYAFILEGFEDDWNYVGDQRLATYTNLKPGKYTFKVKASNTTNVWCELPTTLLIEITPPWWKTIVFRILLTILLISIGYFLYQMRISILKKRQKQLEERVRERTEDLKSLNELLEEKQIRIGIQNEQLIEHRSNLERLVEDRTMELISAKEKAEESDRLKSAFLANMSHEVRTPMNAIMGFSSLLDDDELTKEERKRFIDMISNNGEALMNLFNNILDISKIESSQIQLYKELFCLEDVLRDVHDFFNKNNTKGIDIILEVEENRQTKLFNDSARFRQIIYNLVSNAVKYTEEGYVKTSCRLLDDHIELYVEDSGIGISEDEQINIFDRFHKVEADKAKLYRGVGVGLTICKNLVDLMGGSIFVESGLGKGSKFTVMLPYGNRNNKESVPVTKEEIKNKEGFDIIIAEDEDANFDLVKRILRRTKANLHWARNGKEAVEIVHRISKTSNCLVIMDIKMPIMDGFESFNLIKEYDPNIPIIAVTAYAQPAERDRILKHGFDGYLAKPIKFKELLDIVDGYHREMLMGGEDA